VLVRLSKPPAGGLLGLRYEAFCVGGTVIGSAVVTDPGAGQPVSVGQTIKIKVTRE
jgi:hypothetical protein